MSLLFLIIALFCWIFGFLPLAFSGILNTGTLALTFMAALFTIIYLIQRKILLKNSPLRRWIEKMASVFTLCLLGLTILYSGALIRCARFNPPSYQEPVTVIVLGCQLVGDQPSTMLARRLTAAAHYLKANPLARCVVSGGQGSNEDYTEAAVMKNYLTKLGIEPQRIYLEDRSTNTRENLAFSAQIVAQEELPSTAVIATDGFHQLRASIYARRSGFSQVYAISGVTPIGMLPCYAAREFFAIIQALFLQS